MECARGCLEAKERVDGRRFLLHLCPFGGATWLKSRRVGTFAIFN